MRLRDFVPTYLAHRAQKSGDGRYKQVVLLVLGVSAGGELAYRAQLIHLWTWNLPFVEGRGDTFRVALLTALLVLGYSAAAWVARIGWNRPESEAQRQAIRDVADSVYYLGFLLTLVGLALSFGQFTMPAPGEDAAAILGVVQRTGVALFSTIFGLIVRIVMMQVIGGVTYGASIDRLRSETNALSAEFERCGWAAIACRRVLERDLPASVAAVNDELDRVSTALQRVQIERQVKAQSDILADVFARLQNDAGNVGEALRDLDARVEGVVIDEHTIQDRLESVVVPPEAISDRLNRLRIDPDVLQDKLEEIAVPVDLVRDKIDALRLPPDSILDRLADLHVPAHVISDKLDDVLVPPMIISDKLRDLEMPVDALVQRWDEINGPLASLREAFLDLTDGIEAARGTLVLMHARLHEAVDAPEAVVTTFSTVRDAARGLSDEVLSVEEALRQVAIRIDSIEVPRDAVERKFSKLMADPALVEPARALLEAVEEVAERVRDVQVPQEVVLEVPMRSLERAVSLFESGLAGSSAELGEVVRRLERNLAGLGDVHRGEVRALGHELDETHAALEALSVGLTSTMRDVASELQTLRPLTGTVDRSVHAIDEFTSKMTDLKGVAGDTAGELDRVFAPRGLGKLLRKLGIY